LTASANGERLTVGLQVPWGRKQVIKIAKGREAFWSVDVPPLQESVQAKCPGGTHGGFLVSFTVMIDARGHTARKTHVYFLP
jgi:hypothetical protein